VTLPEYFALHGYHTLSAGKIFHKHGDDGGEWAFQEYAHPGGGNKGIEWKVKPEVDDIVIKGYDEFMWGACKAPLEETKDYKTCKWAADQLRRDFKGKPFFMAVGISKPHLPWYVPQAFFDLYPLESLTPIEFKRDDLDDITRENGEPIFKPTVRFQLAERTGKHKEAAQAYMAAVSYADACLGVLFDALEKNPCNSKTIVMLWGDHGWHLAEKMHYGKCWLWEESARVPFIVRVPKVSPPGIKCEGVVNLLDMYPTLIELCGLPPNPENEGRSFAALTANPDLTWNTPTLTTYNFKNHSLFDGRYRYTWYGGKAEGAEELYDHRSDPMEYTNLASNPEYKSIIERLKKCLPTHNEPPAPETDR
jgi:arylsulfatase A-like enzyme